MEDDSNSPSSSLTTLAVEILSTVPAIIPVTNTNSDSIFIKTEDETTNVTTAEQVLARNAQLDTSGTTIDCDINNNFVDTETVTSAFEDIDTLRKACPNFGAFYDESEGNININSKIKEVSNYKSI